MKRLMCLVLALIMTLGTLVACEDNIIDDANKALDDFDYEPAVVEQIALDFYIISGEGSMENANLTVKNKIRDEFKELYNTTVEVHFVPAEDYAETVLAAHTKREPGKISIALVNSEELYNELYERDVLVNLYNLYSDKTYGTLKKQLANLLPLTYGTEKVYVKDENGNVTGQTDQNTSYAVPNNHVFGEYEYILVNKVMAQFCNELDAAQNCDTVEKAEALKKLYTETYLQDASVQAKLEELGITADEVVKIGVRGNYEDIVKAQSDWYYNIVAYPEATLADVYSSCFVVLGDAKYGERAMQIIYKFNTDTYFRNLLQYGVKDINYREILEDGKVVGVTPIISDVATYNMSLKYTGDIFKAYFCEGVCIFCTEEHKCEEGEHIYWIPENRENCENHVGSVAK